MPIDLVFKAQKTTGASYDWLVTREDGRRYDSNITQTANGNGITQIKGDINGSINVGSQQANPEMSVFLNLFQQYGSPKLLESFTAKLKQIKKMVEEG